MQIKIVVVVVVVVVGWSEWRGSSGVQVLQVRGLLLSFHAEVGKRDATISTKISTYVSVELKLISRTCMTSVANKIWTSDLVAWKKT